MRTSTVAGLIFANTSDELLGDITNLRSMASVPIGGRYRIIDFALSNMVNAGITDIGIITTRNYRSLMDHVGSGIAYDLDRKSGGLRILPPYNNAKVKKYHGVIEPIMGNIDFVERSKADNLVLCAGDFVANIDLEAAINAHIKSDADITVVYTSGKSPDRHESTMLLELEGDTVKNIDFSKKSVKDANYSIGTSIIKMDAFLSLIKEANKNKVADFNRGITAKNVGKLKICGFKHTGAVYIMDSFKTYYDANMAFIDNGVRHDLLSLNRPILTKTRDDMPTRYGTKAKVSGSIVGDGCIIDGTVKNSVLFRGVKVKKGAVVENSIIMQEATVEENAHLCFAVTDKNSTVESGKKISGSAENIFYLGKKQML